MESLLYLPDNEYQKSFEAEVTKTKEDDKYIVLEKTLFYKEGGGQPSDRGKISWKDGDTEVVDVKKKQGEIRHYLEGDIPDSGTKINGEINWERRYKHMRMHTAQHIVSWVVLNMFDASTAGNQIHEDYSRIDFKPVDFSDRDIEKIEKAANSLIQKELEVEKKMMDRELLEDRVQEGRTNIDIIPSGIDPLRIVVIGGEDICPCGGTHVDNLKEIGRIKITNKKSKGTNT